MPEITSRTRVAAVIGWPVSHSLSPVIHNAGFRSLGLDIVYTAFAVRPGAAASALDAMRALDLLGLSVTMPHKVDVSSLVDEVSTAASTLGSVNTVELRDGRTIGHSTDGDGLIGSLQKSGVEVAGRTVLVVGAGGAARAIVDALARHRAAEVVIANRTIGNATAVSILFPGARSISLDDRAAVGEAMTSSSIVINCTSVGMHGASVGSPIDSSHLTTRHTVVDLVYHPIETELLASARTRGCIVVDGLGMLVHQAALQQRIWTGSDPDIDAMTAAARAALEHSG